MELLLTVLITAVMFTLGYVGAPAYVLVGVGAVMFVGLAVILDKYSV